MPRAVTVAVLVALGSGCYLSHERIEDAAVVRDAGRDAPPPPPIDARPIDGTWWTLDPIPVSFQVRCQYFAGTSAFIRVRPAPFGPCQFPGPIEVSGFGTEWYVQGWTWTAHGAACGGPAISTEQEIQLPAVAAGTNRVVDASTMMAATFEVFDAPGPGCAGPFGDGVECRRDCDCESGICAAILGDAWCGNFCGRPCGGDDGCASGQACEASDHGSICAVREAPECSVDGDCPPGRVCGAEGTGPPVCGWSGEDSGNPPCRVDSECPEGRSCIEETPGRSDRRCGIRCTDADMPCPGGLECLPSPFGGVRWTCGFWEG